MLFATSLILEHEPLVWARLPAALGLWVQNAGGVSALGIALVLIARSVLSDPGELNLWDFPPRLRFLLSVLKFSTIASGLGYLALIVVWIANRIGLPGLARFLPRINTDQPLTYGDWVLTLSGSLALLVVFTPIAIDLVTRTNIRRIWAIARLSWKEAVRGRVIWVFGSIALIFLFADWFVPHKPEDQVRNYVRVLYWSITPLFLTTAGLLGAFSIPNDVKNNTIHTIVTKPVEKFEIVLGRFLGYGGLLTIGLFGVAGLSLIYVERGVNDEAKQESYKARVPQYGQLQFAGTKFSHKGEDVGLELTHRSFIKGPTGRQREPFRQFAIWDFADIPTDVSQREVPIIFEFSFDIYRLSKGEEGQGVACTFTFADVNKFISVDANGQAQELDIKADQMKMERERRQDACNQKWDAALLGKERAVVEEMEKKRVAELDDIRFEMTAKFRIFQTGEMVTDFHTQSVSVPAKDFQELLKDAGKRTKGDASARPSLRVFMSVDPGPETQLVGVAQFDFYLLAYEKSFWQNFIKGVIGMWCTHMLVLGVALALSTYLSSVISLLGTAFLYLAGLNIDHLREIAERKVEGSGPLESGFRTLTQRAGALPLDASPTTSLIQNVDSFFSWWVGRILNLIPNVNRHDLHQYVANGFDIGWFDILLLDNALPLFGYLALWAILAYYLMKFREIANPT